MSYIKNINIATLKIKKISSREEKKMNFYYKFNFYLNAKHMVLINGEESDIHPHTWEIKILIVCKNGVYVEFSKFENLIENYFHQFEGKILNDFEIFHKLNPSMENIGKVFLKDINQLLEKHKFSLKSLEISENPTRNFIIST